VLFSKTKPRYADNLNVLVALVTQLGYTDWNMRSTSALAKAVMMPESEVLKILTDFPAIFRRSGHVSPKGLVYFQLHVRHALRWRQAADDEEQDKLPLEPPMVNAILDFVVKAADHEQRSSLAQFTTWIATIVALLSAAIAVWARTKC
jgi:hypothetical protein